MDEDEFENCYAPLQRPPKGEDPKKALREQLVEEMETALVEVVRAFLREEAGIDTRARAETHRLLLNQWLIDYEDYRIKYLKDTKKNFAIFPMVALVLLRGGGAEDFARLFTKLADRMREVRSQYAMVSGAPEPPPLPDPPERVDCTEVLDRAIRGWDEIRRLHYPRGGTAIVQNALRRALQRCEPLGGARSCTALTALGSITERVQANWRAARSFYQRAARTAYLRGHHLLEYEALSRMALCSSRFDQGVDDALVCAQRVLTQQRPLPPSVTQRAHFARLNARLRLLAGAAGSQLPEQYGEVIQDLEQLASQIEWSLLGDASTDTVDLAVEIYCTRWSASLDHAEQISDEAAEMVRDMLREEGRMGLESDEWMTPFAVALTRITRVKCGLEDGEEDGGLRFLGDAATAITGLYAQGLSQEIRHMRDHGTRNQRFQRVQWRTWLREQAGRL